MNSTTKQKTRPKTEELLPDEGEERKEILRRYRRLLRLAKPLLGDGDAKEIKKAFNLSMEAHQNMRRKSGEPYIYHPLAVAQICVEEIGLGTTSIICALLHDVVEDTEIELGDVRKEFGPKVARIIDGLTKISGAFEEGSSAQAENFRKMLLTLSDDVRVILIKIADRLHNMRTLESMPRHKQLKVASETNYIYAPLAHRLGLYIIKSELEDLHLRYTEAQVYQEMASKIKASHEARQRFIRSFSRPIQKELANMGFRFEIKGRTKSISSILAKMRRQSIPFEEVYDLFAIRIILNTRLEQEKAACWQAYSIVTDHYKPNPDRLRDWVSTPKSNGYESLHTTVMSKAGTWVEVQIRTKRMDEIAEKGYAAHWKYKDNPGAAGNGLEQWIAQVREMLEGGTANAIEFIDEFRSNLFQDEVFIFTPKGELKILPFGATALDFAFEIHTEVGLHCLGAKVNQHLVPLNHVLNNGDQVEILTSRKQKPNSDWLAFVVTGKAKGKIKDALKESRKREEKEGKEILSKKLEKLKLSLNNETINQLRALYDASTPNQLFSMAARGTLNLKRMAQIKQAQPGSLKSSTPKIKDGGTFTRELQKAKGQERDILIIGEDADFVDYRLSKCCNPIPGDDIFGFITVNEGIKIHRTNCPNSTELLSRYGYRVIKAQWESKKKVSKEYAANLRILGTDRIGLVNDVTKIISSQLRVNINTINISTNQGVFTGDIELFVSDKSELDGLIRKIEKVEGIVTVNREEQTT